MTTHDSTDAAVATLPLAPGRWTLDALHSGVSFSIRHLGLAKVRGRFTEFDATLDVGATPGDVKVEATVQLGSIDTGNTDRDAHVTSPEFLDVEKNPTMTFTSTRIAGSDEEWIMEGDLTIAGVTHPVTFDVEFSGTGEMMGQTHAGFGTTGQISRKDFGIDFGAVYNAGLGDVVKFELDLEFLAPGDAERGPS
jgi:polyisoprenoid-binding protein YceI